MIILWECASTSYPRVSYLFFADNSIIFLRAASMDVKSIKGIIEIYEPASDQKISME